MDTSISPVLVLNDLPAYGRVALALAVPVLERHGFQVTSLPTALLSTHGAYKGAVCVPQTAFLEKALAHLKSLSISFAAVCTGFVAEREQFSIVEDALVSYPAAFHLVDPILGDNGRLYGFFTRDSVSGMRGLIARADCITPNVTEAALLLGKAPESQPHTEDELLHWLDTLSRLGPRFVVITSVNIGAKKGQTGIAAWDAQSQKHVVIEHESLSPGFPGTGDFFAAQLLAQLLLGNKSAQEISWSNFLHALKHASGAVQKAIRASIGTVDPLAGLRDLDLR